MNALLFLANGRIKYERTPFFGWPHCADVRTVAEYTFWLQNEGPLNRALMRCGIDMVFGDALVFRTDGSPIEMHQLLERLSEVMDEDDGRTRVAGGRMSDDLYSYLSVTQGWPAYLPEQ